MTNPKPHPNDQIDLGFPQTYHYTLGNNKMTKMPISTTQNFITLNLGLLEYSH